MKMRLALCFVLFAAPAFAQPPHADVVAQVKSTLQAQGVSLADSCGAFQITKRVAWALRGEGAGTLDKPNGNNCDGRAVDIIIYPDGHAFDILTDAGGSNGPSWSAIAPVDVSRWRAATDPGDTTAPPAVPPIAGTPPVSPVVSLDLSPILARLAAIEEQNERIYADSNNRRDAQTAELKAAIDSPAWYAKVFGNTYVQLALVSLGTYFTTHQAMK